MSEHDDLHRLGFKLKFAYSMVGLLLGLGCIISGVILGLAGVAGHTTWTASLLGLSTQVNDATPGVVIFIVGIFFVFITRFKVRGNSVSYRVANPIVDNPIKKIGSKGSEEASAMWRVEEHISYAPVPPHRRDYDD